MNLQILKNNLDSVRSFIDNPSKGLPEDVFLFATEITPMVNVDLLVRDENGRILLSWRKDKFYEEGWHVPGGIIRLKETFEQRIKKVAELELFCSDILWSEKPLEIVPIICHDMVQRGHFISFVYECRLPKHFKIDNSVSEGEAGFLKWFDKCPDNILKVHEFYRKYWENV